MSKRGQFAVEHLLTIGFAILIIIPVTYMFYSYSHSQTDELIMSRVNAIGNKIVDNSESMYYLGEPSKITLKENFPDKIKKIWIQGQRELIFEVTDKNITQVFISATPIKGPYYENVAVNCSDASRACYSQGIKNVQIHASEDASILIIS